MLTLHITDHQAELMLWAITRECNRFAKLGLKANRELYMKRIEALLGVQTAINTHLKSLTNDQ